MGCNCKGQKRVLQIKRGQNCRVILMIEGMNCSHCVLMVEGVLKSADGLKDVLVEQGWASFQAPRGYDLTPVIEAIEALGYQITERR